MSGSNRLGITGIPPSWRRVMTVCDEWLPTRGGISKFNRSWTIAAAALGIDMSCLVETATPAEFADAHAHGIRLITAERTPAGPELYVPSREVLEVRPQVVIGHDIVSGSIAAVYAKLYLDASFVYIVHAIPSETEPYKRSEEAALRTESRELETRENAACADVVAAVGPRLTLRAKALVGDGYGDTPVLQLDPGIDGPTEALRRRMVPEYPVVLMLGRTTHIEPKGLDIGACAVARVSVAHGRQAPDLLVRGAPPEACATLRTELVARTGLARHRVDVRTFTNDLDEIRHSITRASVVIMPSRAEGFGLGALEAIGMGTPVLVSARSGLAEILRELLGPGAEPLIVDVDDDFESDVRRWAKAIQRVLDDLPRTFEYTHGVRETLSKVLRWDTTVRTLVDRLPIPVQRTGSGLSTCDSCSLSYRR